MDQQTKSSSQRRSFLTRLRNGAASVAALAFGGTALAQVKSAPAGSWQPARHEKDDWMDALPGKHRFVCDTTSAAAFRNGLLFANNFLTANRSDYGLQDQDLAIIVVARHLSTGYGFNNAMWAKYGVSLLGEMDGQAKEPPKTNPTAETLASLAGRGVHFAVCSMATRRLSRMIASSAGITEDAAFAELSANLVSNAQLVSAGIVAVNRAQERGYSLATA